MTDLISSSPRAHLLRGAFVIAGDTVMPDGAVYQEGGWILEVGPYAELRRRHPVATVLGSSDVAVLPGFVNAHQHGKGMSNFALGYLDDVLEPWVTRLFVGTRVDVYLDTL